MFTLLIEHDLKWASSKHHILLHQTVNTILGLRYLVFRTPWFPAAKWCFFKSLSLLKCRPTQYLAHVLLEQMPL
ncbi:hypothetical protein CDEST_03256 [Colletotrichum destructivum]|uniref:Uncharacterized protein n=1 Tax=Colletotrichum destructivum TaxID=34406 RepID=A0AAX4I4Z9_9PEZI|nr:hypothetical protein CDEST_03256 [Colletotrichum destructivum]